MAASRRNHSIIDLTEDDLPETLPSPPRPTIATRIAPRIVPTRRLRDGSASTTASSATISSGTVSSTQGRARSAAARRDVMDESFELLDGFSSPVPLDKGKGRATSMDLAMSEEEKILSEEGDRSDSNEPAEDNLLSAYQCPICLSPPLSAVLTPCGHVLCGACLFSTLKTQAIRERRKPNPIGTFPSKGPGIKRPARKYEEWYARYGADAMGKIKGRILTGSCPVCRMDIVGGFGEPGEGGVIHLEMCTVTSIG